MPFARNGQKGTCVFYIAVTAGGADDPPMELTATADVPHGVSLVCMLFLCRLIEFQSVEGKFWLWGGVFIFRLVEVVLVPCCRCYSCLTPRRWPIEGGALCRRRHSSGWRRRHRETPPAQSRVEAVRGLRQGRSGLSGKFRAKSMAAFCLWMRYTRWGCSVGFCVSILVPYDFRMKYKPSLCGDLFLEICAFALQV